jgi:hypothetical protein
MTHNMSEVKLNWSTAKVEDSKLTVDAEGEVPSGWKDSFDSVARLLGGSSDWGEVSFKKKTVRVSDVTAGNEEKLRHFLESVVAQANADHAPDDAPDDSEREESDEDADEDQEEPSAEDDSGTDSEMSDRFRSFAD